MCDNGDSEVMPFLVDQALSSRSRAGVVRGNVTSKMSRDQLLPLSEGFGCHAGSLVDQTTEVS